MGAGLGGTRSGGRSWGRLKPGWDPYLSGWLGGWRRGLSVLGGGWWQFFFDAVVLRGSGVQTTPDSAVFQTQTFS